MAHHKSAIKRIRQSRRRMIYNRGKKKLLRETLKAVRNAKTAIEGQEKLKLAYSVLDKVVKKGLIHKNNAANHKSGLAKLVAKLA